MPRRPSLAAKPAATPLPADWRKALNYRVGLMLVKVPQEDYETAAQAFEAHARGRLSDDWRGVWREWRRGELARRTWRRGMFD